MAASGSRLDKDQVNIVGTAGDPSQRAQRGAQTAGRLHARRLFEKILPTFATVMICAAGIAMVFHAARIGNAAGNPGAAATEVEANRQPLTLKQISSLDQKTFEHSLAQLRQVMEQPSPKPVADQQTLIAIAGKLRRTGESTPDYWPTVIRFIQFASSRMAPSAPPPGQPPRILSEILSVGLMRGIRVKGITILLDDGYLGNGEFTNCRIIFTQNPIRLTNAHFRNCVFEIPTTDPPSPYIKKVSQILLSSNLSVISIPTLH
jgi:hypothetical protein